MSNLFTKIIYKKSCFTLLKQLFDCLKNNEKNKKYKNPFFEKSIFFKKIKKQFLIKSVDFKRKTLKNKKNII